MKGAFIRTINLAARRVFEAEGATKRFVYEEEVMAFLRQHLELQEAGGGGGSTHGSTAL